MSWVFFNLTLNTIDSKMSPARKPTGRQWLGVSIATDRTPLGSALNSRASRALPAGWSFLGSGRTRQRNGSCLTQFLLQLPSVFSDGVSLLQVSKDVRSEHPLHPGILGKLEMSLASQTFCTLWHLLPKPGDLGAFLALRGGKAVRAVSWVAGWLSGTGWARERRSRWYILASPASCLENPWEGL